MFPHKIFSVISPFKDTNISLHIATDLVIDEIDFTKKFFQFKASSCKKLGSSSIRYFEDNFSNSL
jgi:hypothetical protein